MKRIQFNANDMGGGVVAASYEKAPMACTADGCKWRASASFGGAPFACIAHQGVEDYRAWPGITRKTAELQWLADFIAEIQRGINFPKPGVSWQSSAAEFFNGSDWPWLSPDERERKAPDLYIYRLLSEARAMAQGKARPKPFVPHAQTEEWKRAIRKPAAVEAD